VLFSLLTVAIADITAALKGPDLAALWFSMLAGMLLAWSLATLRPPKYQAVLILVLGGSLYLLLVPGGLSSKLALFSGGGIRWLLGLNPYYYGEKTDARQLAILLFNLNQNTEILVTRLQIWLTAFASGKPIFDPLAATMVWNGCAWIVASWAGWMVETYENALLAALPALLLSLGTLSSVQHMVPGLYLLLGLTLLLLGAEKQERRQKDWNSNGMAYPTRKGRQIINSTLVITVALVLFSNAVQSLSAERIRQWMDELRRPASRQSGNLAQSLGIVPEGTPVPDVFRAVRSPGLPREHLIGAGPELSSRVVMTVNVSKLADISQGGQPLPIYWRGFTYDFYTGQGWSSSDTTNAQIAANTAIQSDQMADHILIREDIFPVEDLGGNVYAAGEPVRLNLQSEVAWRSTGDLFGLQIQAKSAYEVFSLIPVVDEQTLKQAGITYPDWVVQRFLTLPAEVPERVKDLALRLTASAITPYERAVAIQNYLRSYPYTLDVPIPPAQRDITDYFLFDLKKGYCDYFATAMVVLARAAGIPARLAIGYATGDFNLNSKRFIVSEADAHSWAEIYFPGTGWVPFEATPSRPVLTRSQPIQSDTNQTSIYPVKATGKVQKNNPAWLLFPETLAALLALFGIFWISVDGYRLRRLSEMGAAVEVYRRLLRHAERLGVVIEPGITPYEFSQALRTRIVDLSARGVQAAIKPDLAEDVREIVDGIVFTSFRKNSSGSRLTVQWQRLRWQLWLVWVWKTIGCTRTNEHSQTGESVR
jgi:hypothetical protein